jgi:hypothetical protein
MVKSLKLPYLCSFGNISVCGRAWGGGGGGGKEELFVVFVVLTAVVTESYIFWYIASCSTFRGSPYFGGTCHLYLQNRRVNQAKSQHEVDCW